MAKKQGKNQCDTPRPIGRPVIIIIVGGLFAARN